MITELISSGVTVTAVGLSSYFLKRYISENDDFKKKIEAKITRLEIVVTEATDKISYKAQTISEKADLVSKAQAEFRSDTTINHHMMLSQIEKSEEALKKVESTSDKVVEILKSIFNRVARAEQDIRSIKIKVDEHHVFIKTKK